MLEKTDRPFQLLSFDDDQPNESRGALIPRPKEKTEVQFSPTSTKKTSTTAYIKTALGVALPAFALLLLVVLGTAGYGLVASNNLASVPVVTIIDPYTQQHSTLTYGPQIAFTQQNIFLEARDAFIEEGETFIELDISAHQLRYFKRGVLLQSTEILSVGQPGSWWAVPAGLYKVEELEKKSFSNLAQVNLPFTVSFGGNYIIHGVPVYPDKTVVTADNHVGGIRLATEDAEALYQSVYLGVPVLVHTAPVETDDFIYEPTVPDVSGKEYLIADVENGTILAGSGLATEVPIASLTKLMTAVVAAEKINLDSRVKVVSPTFITSLIPRLADRNSVSVYSLLQLLLVESSNEAAEVIANQLGRNDFLNEMNDKARQLGMLHTTFTDPSGLDSGNTSTVEDLYRLVRYIHANRNFIFEITNTNAVTNANGSGEFEGLVNFNQIKNIDNFLGGKVGETLAAGQTSISLHQMTIQGEDRVVMIILLGSSKRTADVQTLMHHVETRFSQ